MGLAQAPAVAVEDLAGAVARDGFAVVVDVIGPATVSALRGAVDAIPQGMTALARGGRVYAVRDLLRRVAPVRRLAESTEIRALVEPVLGPGAFVVRGLLFDKTPEANWVVPWHQDLTIAVRRRLDVPGFGPWTEKAGIPHVQPPTEVLERMLTVRVHLDDCFASNAPLRVLPGSHLAGRLGDGSARQWQAQRAAVACLVGSGGALVMRPLLLHASSTATSPSRRRVIHLEFAAEPLSGGLEWFEAEECRLPGRSDKMGASGRT